MNDHYLKPGTRLKDKYVIGTALGSGGFGVTYIGFDTVLEHQIAIKEYFPTAEAKRGSDGVTVEIDPSEKEQFSSKIASFKKEASLIFGSFDLPGICNIRDYFEENGTAYIVQEYLSGGTLKDYLNSKGRRRISYGECLELFAPVLEGLCHLHSMGIVHRDISPDNLMLDSDGKLRLIDFGASAVGSVLKESYAAPEQFGRPDETGPWSDIYSICAVMYESLTGSKTPSSISRINSRKALPKISAESDIPHDAEDAILKGLSISIADRFFYAGMLLDKLGMHSDTASSLLGKIRANWGDSWLAIITEGDDLNAEKKKKISAATIRRLKRVAAIVLSACLLIAVVTGIFIKTHPQKWLSLRVQLAQHQAESKTPIYYKEGEPEYDRILELFKEKNMDGSSFGYIEISDSELKKLNVATLNSPDNFPATIDLVEDALDYVLDQHIGDAEVYDTINYINYDDTNNVCYAESHATNKYKYNDSSGKVSHITVDYDRNTKQVYSVQVEGAIKDAKATMKKLLPILVPEMYLTDKEIDAFLAQTVENKKKQSTLTPIGEDSYDYNKDVLSCDFSIYDNLKYRLSGRSTTDAENQTVTVTICTITH